MNQEQAVQEQVSKTVVGKVISNKMDKTIIVEIMSKYKHPLYGKYIKRFSKMSAHDEENQSQIGDTVEIRASRPISKKKSWILVKIVETAEK